ncbi:MAG: NUDIX domain-containing protein [Nanoarchaeota archaeon]|nr:NUDIX domain-containing protein [Nanoarchaeota archaeon]
MPHINEKIDYTVETFIVYNGRVLLRKHDKYNMWLSVGGHIESDEDPNEAAVREVKEEVGLDVELYSRTDSSPSIRESYKELIPPRFMNRHNITETHEHITLVYFAKSKTNKIEQSETERSKECRWFTAEEIDDPKYGIDENIRVYAHSALETLV